MVPRFDIVHILSYTLLCLLPWTRSEFFTAISEVEHLLETHQRIIDDLDHYIKLEENRLLVLKKHLNHYRREQEKALEDIPNYLGNPINAFTLIKRLTTDLDSIEDSIKIGTEYIKNVTMNHRDVKYPDSEDLAGAVRALIRLQETYRLDVKDLAAGILNGIIYSTPMTTSDCFELARTLYLNKDYKNALPWFLETLRKFKEENETYNFDEVDILEHIGFSYYLTGDVRGSLEWTKKLLEIDPNHPRASGNIPHYEKLIEEEQVKIWRRQRGETLEDLEVKNNVEDDYQVQTKRYEALCRGEMELPPSYTKRLFCRYLTETHPFLKLAPIKMEYLYLVPNVIVFHEVLSDEEIEFIQAKAKPRFKRAVVHDAKTGELVPADYRISKSAWLQDSEWPAVARVSRRVSDMTGLSMSSAEDLQVVNYGIGGHYEPHYDFARFKRAEVFNEETLKREPTDYRIGKLMWLQDSECAVVARVSRRVSDMTGLSMSSAEGLQVCNYGIGGYYGPHHDFLKFENAFEKFSGNRIATVLFYMSEVSQGGATVFTRLGLSVFPIKGAALYWMNLHPSGEGDISTRHAACPVLRGSKWVCNKWIHQGGQELLKPCSLDYKDESYLHKIPKPIPKTSR